jgi:hypothetical protein
VHGQIPQSALETIVLREIDAPSWPVCQIELWKRHAQFVVDREPERGLEIQERRDWR